jgi:hypothetical protein
MDTNVVMPLNGKDVDRCKVVFDYWLDEGALQQAAASSTSSSGTAAAAEVGAAGLSTGHGLPGSAAIVQAALQSQFVQDSLASSHQVQVGRGMLCVLTCLWLYRRHNRHSKIKFGCIPQEHFQPWCKVVMQCAFFPLRAPVLSSSRLYTSNAASR